MPPKSKWWAYFERVDGQFAKCKACLSLIKTCGNTSNLKNHTEKLHPSLVSKVIPSVVDDVDVESADEDEDIVRSPKKQKSTAAASQNVPQSSIQAKIQTSSPSTSATTHHSQFRQGSIKESFQLITEFQRGGNKNYEVTAAIVYMLCKDNLPFTTVEKPGFLKLLKTVAPHYKAPSRITIKKMIEQKFDFIANEFRNKFMGVSSFTLTTDIWTDTQQTRSFLGVTVHFPDEEKLVSCTLGVLQLNESHTSQYIADQLLSTLDKWDLKKENVHCAVY
ncbi:hypothetical protein GE061_000067 [Apolygus lucorum]|uniref:BED-type domain-containing protein n=1 Tax=Apolygus lucorum TaxID=248454 RepID=A0A6A4KN23_APOLU|nr:hypothetical protein GE061_000064 [Apolygus lucorum]KAF6215735.1 hypothetical protein GE061_000067 [Apolygus lucorum]